MAETGPLHWIGNLVEDLVRREDPTVVAFVLLSVDGLTEIRERVGTEALRGALLELADTL